MTTDATAARLRENLHVARHAMERAYAAYGASEGPYDELVRLNAAMGAADKAYDAALDTLIQYHRQAGAVEALREQAKKMPVADKLYKADDLALASKMWDFMDEQLAAAQARLAAYEEERWERAQPIMEKPMPELDAFPRAENR